jgi:dihydrofolate reductase
LIKDNLAAEINKLKQQSGKNISVGGSPTLVRSLLQENLLDEFKLMIHPVIVGKGKRLFTEDVDLKRLQLVDSKVTGSGVVIVSYQPVQSKA